MAISLEAIEAEKMANIKVIGIGAAARMPSAAWCPPA